MSGQKNPSALLRTAQMDNSIIRVRYEFLEGCIIRLTNFEKSIEDDVTWAVGEFIESGFVRSVIGFHPACTICGEDKKVAYFEWQNADKFYGSYRYKRNVCLDCFSALCGHLMGNTRVLSTCRRNDCGICGCISKNPLVFTFGDIHFNFCQLCTDRTVPYCTKERASKKRKVDQTN